MTDDSSRRRREAIRAEYAVEEAEAAEAEAVENKQAVSPYGFQQRSRKHSRPGQRPSTSQPRH